MVDGATIKLGEKEYVVPPLNFKALKKLQNHFGALAHISGGQLLTEEHIDSVLEVLLASLQRNYPEMTREFLEEHVDLANVEPLVMAVVNASGLRESSAGEATSR